MPGSAPSVDNDLLSSLGETLLVFEHLFDTGRVGVSRVDGCGAGGGARWAGLIGCVPLALVAMGSRLSRLAPPHLFSPPVFSHKSPDPTCFFTQIRKFPPNRNRKAELCEKTGADD